MTSSDMTSLVIRLSKRTIPGLVYMIFKTVWSYMVYKKSDSQIRMACFWPKKKWKKCQKILSDTLALSFVFLDSPVGQAATRIANIFNSRLFNALLDIQVNFNTLVEFGPWIPDGTYLMKLSRITMNSIFIKLISRIGSMILKSLKLQYYVTALVLDFQSLVG